MRTKYCAYCTQLLPITEYHQKKDGYYTWICKDCHKIYLRTYRQANKDRINARVRVLWNLNREEKLKKKREYYRKNKEKCAAWAKKYQLKTRQKNDNTIV